VFPKTNIDLVPNDNMSGKHVERPVLGECVHSSLGSLRGHSSRPDAILA
jgi:hypothetical protein